MKNTPQTTTVHIAISEYTAGSLRFALAYPKKVIALPDFLAVGPLWRLDEKIGLRNRKKWLDKNVLGELEPDFEKKFYEFLMDIRDIPETSPLYVWAGNNASEQIGLRFILYILRNKANDVININSTESNENRIESGDKTDLVQHTALAEPLVLRQLFEQEKNKKPLSDQARQQLSLEWEELAETENTLHVWRNNQIRPVSENAFDSLILQSVVKMQKEQESQSFIQASHLIGEVLVQSEDVIGSEFLAYRLRELIAAGILDNNGTIGTFMDYSVRIPNGKDESDPV